jgi:uncharacterized membrane protein YdfJ with MMPL/SSD domain
MRLMGRWNWWMPKWTQSVLRVRQPEAVPEVATESV